MSPQQNLPINAIQLIREYSKPITHPLWRTLQIMPFKSLYNELIQYRYINKKRVLWSLYRIIHNDNTIANILYHTTYYNIYIASIILNMPENILYDITLYFKPLIDDDPEFIFNYRH
jgi:hypothetical protein